MKRMINVALPKGRLGEKADSLFARAGYECPELLEENHNRALGQTDDSGYSKLLGGKIGGIFR